jgi:uncharacterized membrane protein YphA (DoxX/SURF4 family)
MKKIVNIARVLVGALFIFSGLVKAIDPLGLAYKMEEFFEVWQAGGFLPGLMSWLHQYAVGFSVFMIILEVVAGVALLVGFWRKLTVWVIFLLVLFFTFLTAFVLFSGKIRACGCFGDCIPLTPEQTFGKDIILLILCIILVWKWRLIVPLLKPRPNTLITIASLIGTILLLWYVKHYLPVIDCLPYKKGNDILALRKMPADAIPDKYDYVFIYKKDGVEKAFDVKNLPTDKSWTFVERKQTLVQKGKNNVPLINDFTLTANTGTDTTEAILSQTGTYYLLFVKNVDAITGEDDLKAIKQLQDKKLPVYIVTSDPVKAAQRYANVTIFTTDMVAIKTAARTIPTLLKMQGPVIQGKWGSSALLKAVQ